jgi:translation elongation factor Ts
MEIKAADVMKLRKMTGAGMMDCKKALIEAEGDFARAQDIIREKGKLIVAKRADRTATEGVVVTKIVGQKAYILCLACETDFVAQNSEYSASAEAMLEVAVKNDAADRDALMAAKNAEGRTVEDAHRLISLYFQMIKGKITPEELDDLEDVAALQGIAHVPARVKCAVLAWHTLEEALDGEGKTDKVTTEEEA